MNDRAEIEWAPRVSLAKIHELYTREARGDCDPELIEEVGFGLYARCLSILEFTEACAGQVRCKRCARAGKETIIEHHHAGSHARKTDLIRCPVCGWQVQWRVYMAESEKVDGQLHAGNALEAFRRYAARYPLCHTGEEKILAIDRLIHEFHWVLVDETKDPAAWKPAGVNLLRGSTVQVIELLNQLTYGEHTPPELLAARDWWRSQRPVIRQLGAVKEPAPHTPQENH